MARRRPIESGSGGSGKGKLLVLIVTVLIAGLVYVLFFAAPAPVSKGSGLIQQSLVALKDIKKESVTFEGDMQIGYEGDYFEFPFSGEWRMDSASKRMNLRLNFEGGVLTGRTVNVDTYAIGDIVYVGIGGEWNKFSAPRTLWGDRQFSKKLMEFAGNFDSKVTGRETVNGRNTYKVEVSPGMSEIMELFESVAPGTLDAMGVGAYKDIDSVVKSVDMVIWVDSSNYLPVKAQLRLTARGNILNPNAVGTTASELVVSGSANFDFNTPFNIVLPSAAQNAVEMDVGV